MVDVDRTVELRWEASEFDCPTEFDVLLGTTSPPNQLVCEGLTKTHCTVDDLAPQETYFWRVEARNSAGLAAGPIWSFTTVPGPRQIRGDVDQNAVVSFDDVMRLLEVLFLDPRPLSCASAADANDDGALEISDAIYLARFLFLGGLAPPAPFPNCGFDRTGDELECSSVSCP